MRLRQATELVTLAVAAIAEKALWLIDDIFYREYRKRSVHPIFIVAQPRSGTTTLHNSLIDADTTGRMYAIRLIEWRIPSIFVHKVIASLGLTERLSNVNFFPENKAGESANKMHPMTLGNREEDGEFFQKFLCHPFVLTRFPYESLRASFTLDALPESKRKQILEWHSLVLKKMSFLNGNRDVYVGKEVLQPAWAEEWNRQYPEAKFIIIARNSKAFVNSFLNLNRNSTLGKTGLDPAIDPAWAEGVTGLLHKNGALLCQFAEKMDSTPHGRKVFLLSFDTFVSNLPETIAALHGELNICTSEPQSIPAAAFSAPNEGSWDGFQAFDYFVEQKAKPAHLELLHRHSFKPPTEGAQGSNHENNHISSVKESPQIQPPLPSVRWSSEPSSAQGLISEKPDLNRPSERDV